MTDAAAGWQRAGAWAERQSERLNAILVREIRRALNGRLFTLAFFILLFLCVLACLGPLLGSSSKGGAGWDVFSLLFSALCVVSFLSLPLMTVSLIHAEIKDRTFELLSITTLTAFRIIRGELMTAVGLFVLYASAVAPFMAFSYLLGGVDLRAIASGIAFAFLGSVFLTLISIVGSVQRAGEASIRVALVLLSILAIGGAVAMVNTWSRPLQEMWENPEIGVILGVFFSNYLTLGTLLFAAATTRLMFASANRAAPVRLAVAAHLLLPGMALAFMDEKEIWLAWAFYSMSVLYLVGVSALGEERALSRRQRRAGRIGRHLPFLWSLFLPGPKRGLAFVFLAGAGGAGISSFFLAATSSTIYDRSSFVLGPWIAYAYLVLFLSGGHLLARLLPSSFQRPILLRAASVALFCLMLLVPFLLSLTLDLELDETPALALFHPIIYLPVVLDSQRDFENGWTCTIALFGAAAVVLAAMAFPLVRDLRAAVAAREIR